MGQQFPTIGTTSLELVPCLVKFDGAQVGATLENCVADVKYLKADLKADQTGDTIIDRRIKGIDITVTTALAEFNAKDPVWKRVFPHATFIETGAKAVEFTEQTGQGDAAFAKELILHPVNQNAAVVDFDHNFYKAVSTEESGFTMGPNDQLRLKIVWRILPDTSVTPWRFYRFGDKALV